MTRPTIILRATELEDLNLLYKWENDERVWFATNHSRPLSKQALRLFIESINDIFTDKQIRLMMIHQEEPVGCVDIFDFDPLHQRACVGIMVDQQYERQGFAFEGILKLKKYAFHQLGMHQLYCTIAANNPRSIALFTKAGFEHTGTRKEWFRIENKWVDELTFQCFNGH